MGIALAWFAGDASAEVSFCPPGTAAGHCENPQGVAVDRESELVYVADRGNNRIDVFNTAGASQSSFGPPQLEKPMGAAVDNSGGASKGDIYAVDSSLRVLKFKPGGEFVKAFGTSGECQINSARDPVAVGPGGVVYVADSEQVGPEESEGFFIRVEEYDESGACLKEVSLFQGNRPVIGLAVDSGGDVYVSDDSGTHGIRKYDPSGTVLYELNEVLPSQAGNPLGVGAADSLFAAEGDGPFRAIGEYDSSGKTLRRFGYDAIQRNLLGIAPFHSSSGEVFGSEEKTEVKYFTLPPAGPIVPLRTLEAAPVGNVKATLKAQINPEGKETQYHFEYVDQESFKNEGGFASPATKSTPIGSIAMQAGSEFRLHPVEAKVGCLNVETEKSKCLAPDTVYHFRVIATNADDPSPGASAAGEFETKPPFEAEIYATEVGVDAASIHAEVNPLGIAVSGYFQYVDDANFKASGFANALRVPSEGQIDFGGGEAPVVKGETIFPLSPGTVYHYRLVAEDPLIEPIVSEERTLTTFSPLQPGQGGPCANEIFRSAEGAFLSDCRAYELVSPLDKNNGDVIPPDEPSTHLPAALNESSPSGQRLTYSSFKAFSDAKGAPYAPQYIAARDPQAGWLTHAIMPPRGSSVLTPGLQLDTEFKAFSADLCDAWIRTTAEPTLAPGAIAGFPNLYRRQDEECGGPSFEALTTVAPTHVLSEAFYPASHYDSLELQGVTADGAETIFVVGENLTEDAPPQPQVCTENLKAEDECELRLYEYSAASGALNYVCILPSGEVNPTACAAGRSVDQTGKARENRVENAISADGSRIFWTAYAGALPHAGKIYVRENASQPRSQECLSASDACTVAVSKKGEEESGTSASSYWAAAKDGSKAIFTTAKEAGKEDLYEFDVASQTTTLIAHEVVGVMGASEDASYVYFASREDRAAGATAGQANLYLYHEGSYRFVAGLVGADLASGGSYRSSLEIEPRREVGRVSPDGLHAAFMSFGRPTGYDNKDANNGKAAAEVYLYEANANGVKGKLICASCNPSGARPVGANILPAPLIGEGAVFWAAAELPVWESSLYAARSLSDDGKSLYFTGSDALSVRDTNGRQDLYQWEAAGAGGCDAEDRGYVPASEGCLSLISTGKSGKNAEFVDASPSGDDVFFSTLSSLVPQDYGLVDIYDARVGGGFAPPAPAEAECEGEACQSPPGPPQAPTPSSASYAGPGNIKGAKARHCAKKKGQRAKPSAKKHCAKGHKGKKSGQRRGGR